MQKNDPITVCAEPGYEAGARQLAEALCLDLSAEPVAGALRLTLGTDGKYTVIKINLDVFLFNAWHVGL